MSVSPPSCPYTYEFITLVKGNPLTIDADNWVINSDPMDYAMDMGVHQYMLKACVVVENTLTRCKNSPVAEVVVTDPCSLTLPVYQPITTTMTASRLGVSTINLLNEFAMWPFVDSVD